MRPNGNGFRWQRWLVDGWMKEYGLNLSEVFEMVCGEDQREI